MCSFLDYPFTLLILVLLVLLVHSLPNPSERLESVQVYKTDFETTTLLLSCLAFVSFFLFSLYTLFFLFVHELDWQRAFVSMKEEFEYTNVYSLVSHSLDLCFPPSLMVPFPPLKTRERMR